MAISSTSTDAEVQAQIDDNADYDEVGSVAHALAYRTAVRVMIGRLERNAEGGSQGDFYKTRIDGLKSAMEDVQAWVMANDNGSVVDAAPPLNFDLSGFRA